MENKICPNCGASMPAASKFCTECGSPFPKEEKPAAPKPAPTPAAPPKPEAPPAEEVPVLTTRPYQEPVTPPPAPVQEPVQEQAPFVPPVIPARPSPAQEPVYAQNPPRQPVNPAPVYEQPMQDPASAVAGTPYEPISTLGWIGIFLLSGLPVIGVLLIIIWACGGCRKQSKKTYARALVIMFLVGLVISVIAGLILKDRIAEVVGSMDTGALNSILNQYGFEYVP